MQRLGDARRRVYGFTLIEVMIVVAIIGIISALAYPQYTSYVQRSRLTEASATLSTVRVRLEQFYQDNRNYGSTATACGIAMPTGEFFDYSCNWGGGGTSQSFLISAAGKSSRNLSGFGFTVDHNRLQRTTAFTGESGLPVNCWLRRRGDVC